jgi:signal transduction histidine kinase
VASLGQLTGGVAHDFNNLLMVVSGQAQSLMRRMTDQKNIRSLEAIFTAASRGEALTRQLLTFSRRQPQNPRTVHFGQTIAAFHDVLASSARGKIDLRTEIPRDIWPVSIDIAEFELALVNLVVNARDAMPEGGSITIAGKNVTLRGDESVDSLKGEFAALTISDTGSGIPPELLPKIFEPFFTTKSPDKGTRLGLSQFTDSPSNPVAQLSFAAKSARERRSGFICRTAMLPSPWSFQRLPTSRMAGARSSLLSRTTRM